MIYEVEVSEQADRDLREIFEYIAFELQSPENAIGQLDRLEEQILSLDAMPKLIELWGMNIRTDVEAKKLHATDREMTTPCFSSGVCSWGFPSGIWIC